MSTLRLIDANQAEESSRGAAGVFSAVASKIDDASIDSLVACAPQLCSLISIFSREGSWQHIIHSSNAAARLLRVAEIAWDLVARDVTSLPPGSGTGSSRQGPLPNVEDHHSRRSPSPSATRSPVSNPEESHLEDSLGAFVNQTADNLVEGSVAGGENDVSDGGSGGVRENEEDIASDGGSGGVREKKKT